MISCLAWIPKGSADPNPKRYELSAVERELLEKQGDLMEAEGDEEEEIMQEVMPKTKDQIPTTTSTNGANDLPAELRMDEYSDDDDDDDDINVRRKKEAMIGNLLIGTSDNLPEEIVEDNHNHKNHNKNNNNDSDSDDDDDDDDLQDVEDTREYMPVDVEGLESMKFASDNMNFDLDDDDDADNGSDVEDTNLQPDDSLIVIAKTEEDFASLEVMVYEEKSGNLYVHHDIPLPSFPLCLAHGDINAEGNAGNYVAVGTFNPGIEVWNLDVLDALEPHVILGGDDTTAADDLMRENILRASTGKKLNKKQSNSGGGLREGSHTDAILALSWNPVHRQVIASGSADSTVKVWDITQASSGPVATHEHHSDKVAGVAWHPQEGTMLASGAYDKVVSILDVRMSTGNHKSMKIPADIESLAWDPHQSHLLTAACEDGTLRCWDVRNLSKPYWSFVAHDYGGCTDISYNPNIPGMLASCAIDKTVKLWDTSKEGNPTCCGTKEMDVGKLYCCSFYMSSPWMMGCGGTGGKVALWDLGHEKSFLDRFSSRLSPTQQQQQQQQQSIEAQAAELEAMRMTNKEDVKEEPTSTKSKKKKKKKTNSKKKKVNRR